jgi:nicotinate dehydrogenase subunit B
MAAVVAGLAQLPEKDVKAISHYVASFGKNDAVSDIQVQLLADDFKQSTQVNPIRMNQGRRIFESACAACHVETSLPSFTNAQTSLALNTNLHSDQPDNLIQTILYGVQTDTLNLANVNVMPAFNASLADEQIVSLIHFLRAKYAPKSRQWEAVLEKVTYYKLNKGNH